MARSLDDLRRKLTVRAHGHSLVLIKRPIEKPEHVLQKALLWAMYLPQYPDVRVEVPLPQPSRYKPDLLALDPLNEPMFWGECGEVGVDKLRFLISRFRRTHLVFSKWDTRLDSVAALIDRALDGQRRSAPIELISFPPEAADWFGGDGGMHVDRRALDTRRWEPR